MPEGHTIHRNAANLNEAFAGQALAVTSPQGRFADSAARINHTAFVQAQAVGKHLLMEFANMLPIKPSPPVTSTRRPDSAA